MRVWDSGWQHINTAFKSLLPELRSLIKVDKTPRAIIFGDAEIDFIIDGKVYTPATFECNLDDKGNL